MAFSAPRNLKQLARSLGQRRAWLLGALALAACDACNREPKVPFKLGSERDATADLAASTQLDAEARSFERATDRPTVDGKAVPLDFVRSLIAHDLDADGDRDVIALVHDAVVRMRLLVSMRDAEGFQEAHEVAGFSAPGDASCTLHGVSLEAPVPDKAVLAITLACGDPPKVAAPNLTLISLEAPPRCYESVALVNAEEPLPFAISASAGDADGDGNSDFVLRLTAPAEAEGESVLTLSLLDRASGLSRDVREPEATFAAWANAAQAQLAKKPAEALRSAQRVLRFERALCRERGEPVLVISGARGIACGKSKAVTSALSTATLALEKLKQGARALVSFADLARRETKPDKRTWERVLTAMAALPSEPGVSLREGPRVEVAQKPRLHMPSARFLDDDHLLLRRTNPVLYDLQKNEESPLSAPLDDLIRDPSGQLALTAIERDGCGSLHLRIERAAKLGTPYLASAPISSPFVAPGASLTPCKQSTGQGHVESGYRALGWAPQGVVLARGADTFVVPLTLAGAPAGEPLALPAGTPLPAPLAAGQAAADGGRYAELTPFGVLVFERTEAAPALLRPDGFLTLASAAQDVAISPSGRRVAVVANGSVYILTREGARAP